MIRFYTHIITIIFFCICVCSNTNAAPVQHTAKKSIKNIQDTVCVVTSNISLHDTLYIKHEDTKANPPQTIWQESKELIITILGAVLSLIVGIVIAFYSAQANKRIEQGKFQEQRRTQLEDKQREIVHEIFNTIVEARGIKSREQLQEKTDLLAMQIGKAQMDIPEKYIKQALHIHAYFVEVLEEPDKKNYVKETELINLFIALYKGE